MGAHGLGRAQLPELQVGLRTDESPFRGLEAFEERHARWFFGHEAYLARMLAALRERRLLVLVGA